MFLGKKEKEKQIMSKKELDLFIWRKNRVSNWRNISVQRDFVRMLSWNYLNWGYEDINNGISYMHFNKNCPMAKCEPRNVLRTGLWGLPLVIFQKKVDYIYVTTSSNTSESDCRFYCSFVLTVNHCWMLNSIYDLYNLLFVT